jgi:transposase InsO family protein
VVPEKLRMQIIQAKHDDVMSEHAGYQRTYQKISSKYYLRRMEYHINEYVRKCAVCHLNNRVPAPLKAPLQSITASQPFEKVVIDMIGRLSSSNRREYIIVATDYFTRYAETRAVNNQLATTIARFMIEQILSRHGCPRILISDRGTNFLSKIVKEINYFFKTEHLLTSPYHPQTNGLTEKTNQTLSRMINHYVQRQKKWDIVLPMITFAYNTACNSSTKASPFYLIFGR